jgi:hypothetical protein
MMGMPDASSLTRRAILEVAARAASSTDPVVRRYRLARVPLYLGRPSAPERFAHLRASHD